MAVATRTFLQLVQAVADSLDLRESGTLTAASTTALTAAGYPYKTNYSLADSNVFVGNEVYITTASATAAPNPNGISQYAPSTGIFTPSFTYSVAPGNTNTFDIYKRGVTIALIRNCINEALRKRAYPGYWPLTIVDDGDMSASGTSSWTASNATITKTTASGGMIYNAQSLRTLLTSSGGYARTGIIYCNDPVNYRTYQVSALVAATVGTAVLNVVGGTGFTVPSYASASWAYSGWGYINFTFDLPDNVEGFVIRLGGTDNNDDIYWNHISVLPVGASSIALPDWVIDTNQVKQVLRAPSNNGPIVDTMVGHEVMWFRPFPNLGDPNSAMRVDFAPSITGPMWMYAYRNFPTLSADADTTFALRSWIELAAQVELLRVLAQRPPSENTSYWNQEYTKRAKRLRKLDQQYMPPSLLIQMDAPYTTNAYITSRNER